jgi:hypothetical protein
MAAHGLAALPARRATHVHLDVGCTTMPIAAEPHDGPPDTEPRPRGRLRRARAGRAFHLGCERRRLPKCCAIRLWIRCEDLMPAMQEPERSLNPLAGRSDRRNSSAHVVRRCGSPAGAVRFCARAISPSCIDLLPGEGRASPALGGCMRMILIEKRPHDLVLLPQRHLFRFDDDLSEIDLERLQAILTSAPERLSSLAAERVLRELPKTRRATTRTTRPLSSSASCPHPSRASTASRPGPTRRRCWPAAPSSCRSPRRTERTICALESAQVRAPCA